MLCRRRLKQCCRDGGRAGNEGNRKWKNRHLLDLALEVARIDAVPTPSVAALEYHLDRDQEEHDPASDAERRQADTEETEGRVAGQRE